MRESVGSTWTIQAVIFFILIFSAFLSLVIQYSKAYIIKNEVLTILEKYEGAESTKTIIGDYVRNQGYKTRGACPQEPDWYGAVDYDVYEKAVSGKKYYYCIKKNSLKTSKKNKYKYYYNVVFFYKFNLPIFGELHTYRVVGETKAFPGANKTII